MRELSRRAGISLKTVVNVESGLGCSPRIELKLHKAFSCPPGRLRNALATDEDSLIRVVKAEEGRWYFNSSAEGLTYHERQTRASEDSSRLRYRDDPDTIQVEAERLRLGYAGASIGFHQVKSGWLSSGHHQTCLVELFQQDEQHADPQRHTYQILGIRGYIELKVHGATNVIGPGDLVTVVESAPFTARPVAPVTPDSLPPHFLITRLATL